MRPFVLYKTRPIGYWIRVSPFSRTATASCVPSGLQSAAITSVTYDTNNEQMDVTFTSGSTYTHERVPRKVFDELSEASSPGRFYNQQIKGQY